MQQSWPSWTTIAPPVGVILLALTWSGSPGAWLIGLIGLVLSASVLAAVHHAEVIAHRVGEPFGSLVLAVSVTVIEVALIVTLMVTSAGGTETLARDTAFAAVMITLNGLVGLALVIGSLRHHLAVFNPEGSGTALAAVITLATLCLVVPSYTVSESGPEFTPGQLAFAAVAAVAVYLMFVFTQTVRHRDFFLPVKQGDDLDGDGHADAPSARAAQISLGLLIVALVGVVGLAKVLSNPLKDGIASAGLPTSFVGVIIAMLVLAPETLAAGNAAARDRVQTSLNLAYGSCLAAIGLTIPVIAVAMIWIDGPLYLGLEPLQVVLLGVTAIVSVLTVVPGRAKPLQGGLHLTLFAAFIALSLQP